MTEIEKMYKLAKVKTINIAEYGSTYIPNNVKIDGELYPPFTAEKQLAIEKVILTKRYRKISYYIIDEDYSATLDYDTTNGDIPVCVTWSKTRDETFADIINHLWQDLTNQEKEEIRNILDA